MSPARRIWTIEDVQGLGVQMNGVTACEIVYGVGRTTAYRLLNRGEVDFPVVRCGRRWVVPTAAVLELLGTDNQRVNNMTLTTRKDPHVEPGTSKPAATTTAVVHANLSNDGYVMSGAITINGTTTTFTAAPGTLFPLERALRERGYSIADTAGELELDDDGCAEIQVVLRDLPWHMSHFDTANAIETLIAARVTPAQYAQAFTAAAAACARATAAKATQ